MSSSHLCAISINRQEEGRSVLMEESRTVYWDTEECCVPSGWPELNHRLTVLIKDSKLSFQVH